MKKVYLALTAGLIAGAGFAQVVKEKAPERISLPTSMPHVGLVASDRAPGDPIYTDQFTNAALWSVAPDADGNAWAIGTSTPAQMVTYMGAMASSTAANGFGYYNGIADLLSSSVTPQDCYLSLIAPINCSANPFVTLEFEQRYRAFNSDQTIVEVSNNGSTWTQWEINTEEPTNGPAQQEVVRINISAVAGGQATVYLRFHWQELGGDPLYGSGYGWMVDDVNVFESWDYDQLMVSAFQRCGPGISYAGGLDYGYFASQGNQTPDINFSGITENLGAQIQAGAKLNADVTGPETYSGTSATTNLAIGAQDSLFCTTTMAPGTNGVYDVVSWFDGTNAEEVTDNDTIYSWFELTDYTYGRDNGVLTGGISAVSGSPDGVLTIGNTMDVFGTAEIGSVWVRLGDNPDNDGNIMYGELWLYDDGLGDWVFVDNTDDHTITSGENDGWVQMWFHDCIDVNDGDLILITAGHYGGAVKPEFGMAQGVDEQTVLGYSDGSSFYLSSPNAIMVRAEVFCDIGVTEEVNSFSVDQNTPNPFNGSSVINYSLNADANVSVKFTDISGKVIYEVNQGAQKAGSYQINLDAANFAQGSYLYTFTIGEQVVTKRMVVTTK